MALPNLIPQKNGRGLQHTEKHGTLLFALLICIVLFVVGVSCSFLFRKPSEGFNWFLFSAMTCLLPFVGGLVGGLLRLSRWALVDFHISFFIGLVVGFSGRVYLFYEGGEPALGTELREAALYLVPILTCLAFVCVVIGTASGILLKQWGKRRSLHERKLSDVG